MVKLPVLGPFLSAAKVSGISRVLASGFKEFTEFTVFSTF